MYNPKKYFDNGATVPAKTDLGAERMDRLRSGEIFTVLDDSGNPEYSLLMDSFDMICYGPIENSCAVLTFIMFGVPVPFYASEGFKKQFADKISERLGEKDNEVTITGMPK